MDKQRMTEMLKGTLEGIVLAILAGQPAYGYEITARLREQGFSDIAEGTIYALLVRIEQRGFVDVTKVPSEKGPPRKVYSLNAAGSAYLDEFWGTWSFLAERIGQLRHHIEQPHADESQIEQPPVEQSQIEQSQVEQSQIEQSQVERSQIEQSKEEGR
jgi:PadR family transcriptional regulator PadR